MLRSLSDPARIGLTWIQNAEPPLALLAELRAEYWNPMFGLVTPEAVSAVHDAGSKVSTWTVDDPEEMARVVESGVDAVVSNRIAELVRFLGREPATRRTAAASLSSEVFFALRTERQLVV